MKANKILIGVILILALSLWAGPGDRKSPTTEFMRHKLTYSQSILESLVLEKFDLVSSNATLLRNMSLTNAFFSVRNPNYLHSLTNFQTGVDRLIAAARTRELQTAMDAYASVAMDCVACHQQFRREQFLRAANPDSKP